MDELPAFIDELQKIALHASTLGESTDPVEQEPRERPLVTMAKGIGGFALGSGAGYAAAHGIDRGLKAMGGRGIPPKVIRNAAPLIGGAAGLGYGLLQHKMMERVKNNLQPEAHTDVEGTTG